MGYLDFIAIYIINECNKNGWRITALKLQKLLYFVQKEGILVFHKKIFYEDVIAYGWGPCIPKIYRKYLVFGNANIPACYGIDYYVNGENKIIIDKVLEKYGALSNGELLQLIWEDEEPWKSILENDISEEKGLKIFFEDFI